MNSGMNEAQINIGLASRKPEKNVIVNNAMRRFVPVTDKVKEDSP